MRADYAGASDTGLLREGNEDSWLAESDGQVVLAAVADGLGGHDGGEVASRMAVDSLHTWFSALHGLRLTEGIKRAHLDVLYAAGEQKSNMGTTLSAIRLNLRSGTMDIGHVGDSRIYLWRQGYLQQLTEDDTVAQMMYEHGEISAEDLLTIPSRHHLTQAVGISRDLIPHDGNVKLAIGDRILLCSDGLTGELDDDQIGAELAKADCAQQAVDALIAACLRTPAEDNVTAVAVFAV